MLALLTFSRTRAKTGQIFCITAGMHRGHEIIRHQCDWIFTAQLISLGIGMSVFGCVCWVRLYSLSLGLDLWILQQCCDSRAAVRSNCTISILKGHYFSCHQYDQSWKHRGKGGKGRLLPLPTSTTPKNYLLFPVVNGQPTKCEIWPKLGLYLFIFVLFSLQRQLKDDRL